MRPLALIMLFGCAAAAAATYRWVDANGVVHYSDTPGPGAKRIELPQAQTYRAPPAPATSTPAAVQAKPAGVYQSCAIVQPANDATLFETEAVTVTVALQPGRRPGDVVSLSFDGAVVAPATPDALDFRISPIDRGAHMVSAVVHDADNRTVCSSTPVTFYVRQPSVLTPQSPLTKPK